MALWRLERAQYVISGGDFLMAHVQAYTVNRTVHCENTITNIRYIKHNMI